VSEYSVIFERSKDRMQVFKRIVQVEDQAIADRLELAKRFIQLETGLTRDQVVAIIEEGLQNDWPLENGKAGRKPMESCRFCGRKAVHTPDCTRPSNRNVRLNGRFVKEEGKGDGPSLVG
jgi:hypothetical protein